MFEGFRIFRIFRGTKTDSAPNALVKGQIGDDLSKLAVLLLELAYSYALALGRLDTSSCQRVKYASSGAIFMSAKRHPISIATNAVMSAIVKRSPATNWCPFSSRFIRSRR